jgi:anti-sigma B factor antagonist
MEQLEREKPGLEVEKADDERGDPLIKLVGELDMASADVLRQILGEVLAKGPKRVVFEVGQLTFMDSSGIAVLVMASNKADRVELRNAQPIVRRVVEVAGLGGILWLDQP